MVDSNAEIGWKILEPSWMGTKEEVFMCINIYVYIYILTSYRSHASSGIGMQLGECIWNSMLGRWKQGDVKSKAWLSYEAKLYFRKIEEKKDWQVLNDKCNESFKIALVIKNQESKLSVAFRHPLHAAKPTLFEREPTNQFKLWNILKQVLTGHEQHEHRIW